MTPATLKTPLSSLLSWAGHSLLPSLGVLPLQGSLQGSLTSKSNLFPLQSKLLPLHRPTGIQAGLVRPGLLGTVVPILGSSVSSSFHQPLKGHALSPLLAFVPMAASAGNTPFTLLKSTHSSCFGSVTSTEKHASTSFITLHRATELSLSPGFPRLHTSLCSSLPLPPSMSAFPTHYPQRCSAWAWAR